MIDEHSTTVAGIPIRWLSAGEGNEPPLVLLHGLGSDTTKWIDVLPLLAEHRRTIAIDLPGFGRSGAPAASYSPAWLAGGVRALLDAIGVERAVVCGNSFGGITAAYLAASWPERCDSLVLVSPVLPNDGPQPSARVVAGFMLTSMPGIGGFATRRYWQRDPAVVVRESLGRNTVDPSRIRPETVRLLEEDAARKAVSPPLMRASYRATRQAMWAMTGRRETTWNVVRSLRAPTLFVWGEKDRVLPVHIGHRAVGELPGSHLIVIDDCGHNPQMEKPDEFARAITSFLRARRAASS